MRYGLQRRIPEPSSGPHRSLQPTPAPERRHQPGARLAPRPSRRAFPAPGGSIQPPPRANSPEPGAAPRRNRSATARRPPSSWRRPAEESYSAAGSPDDGLGTRPAACPPGRFDWLIEDIDGAATQPDNPFFRKLDGAPAASMPGLRGRFAAEWCPSGTSSRESSLLRERGRTDGGVMVRRALLDRDDVLSADDEALPTSPSLPSSRPTKAHWRGSGARWLIWIGRAIVWAVIILIGYRGILAIIQGRTSGTSASSPAATSSPQFPVTMAEAYAMQFGDVYLNFSPAGAARRSRELAGFLGAGADPQLGWNGVGTQRLQAEQVAAVSITGSHSAVVTLLASLSSGRMIELGVPIYAANGGMIVSGNPALLPAPLRATLPTPGQSGDDQATAAALQSQLPAFFEAFASGDRTTLARFTLPGARIDGLNGAVTFGAIDSVYAPAGGSRRTISVTLTWRLPALPNASTSGSVGAANASIGMTYQMTVVRQQGSWDVASIGASTVPFQQGPP